MYAKEVYGHVFLEYDINFLYRYVFGVIYQVYDTDTDDEIQGKMVSCLYK